MASVTVQVPASTTNFGPGFDCFGAALQLWNYVTVEDAGQNSGPELATTAAQLFFTRSNLPSRSVHISVQGEVPPARGLGSSTTLRLGTLLGLDALLGNPLDRTAIFGLCVELETHPDNAAAACYGGFVIAKNNGNQLTRFDVDPAMSFVLLVPDLEVKTSHARQVLPELYRREDILQNLANVSLIAAAMASHNYSMLQGCFADRLHQPYREPLIPILNRVIEGGTAAGALGGFLSGSGSTIACVTLEKPKEVARAMAEAAGQTSGSTMIVRADNHGARILPLAE